MLVATFIDATDGFLARWLRVKEVLPQFDGRRLDDLVDFVMYTCLPLAMVHRMELLPEGFGWVLIVALGASAYGFSQSDVKTANGAFQGFPSYWNIVAFYLYTLPLTSEIAVAIILVFSFLTFVPSYYPYPTQPGTVNRVMLLLSIPWTILVLVALLMSWEESVPHVLARTSVAYPLLYLGVAWGMSLWRIRKAQ
jgi:phosphatidylcholine synthase